MIFFSLPALLSSAVDIGRTLELIGSKNINEPKGLMLILKDGLPGISKENQRSYRDNLLKAAIPENLSLIIMASNFPLTDLDLIHQPQRSQLYLHSVIEFASRLPGNEAKTVTFHLNTLFDPAEWSAAGSDAEEKFRYFDKKFQDSVLPELQKISDWARENNVEIKIETTPVPEFGDRPEEELNRLGNPYPLFSQRNINEIRQTGIGICLDLCHTQTLFQAAGSGEINEDHFERYKGLFPADIDYLKTHSLKDELLALKDGDLIHLNDGAGEFRPEAAKYYHEGLALGRGQIEQMPEIIELLRKKNVGVVLEVNEEDYNLRPNTLGSIDYFKKYYGN